MPETSEVIEQGFQQFSLDVSDKKRDEKIQINSKLIEVDNCSGHLKCSV